MRKRMSVLASLLLVGGLVGQAVPAQAGPWATMLVLRCKVIVDDPLTYPPGTPQDTDYTIECGKGKPNTHPFAVNDTFCNAVTVSPNGKKPIDPPQTGLGNCNISGGGKLIAANCGLSQGTINVTITFKPSGKSVTAVGEWAAAVGGVLPIIGEVKGGEFVGAVEAHPDREKKEQSCLEPGATDFKVEGAIYALGIKAK